MTRADLSSGWVWTASQRRALLLLLAGLCVLLLGRYACNRAYVSDPQPAKPPRSHELASRIDPNEADWPALAALPGMGEKRARQIVDQRETMRKRMPGRRPFETVEDLQKIKGVGPALTEQWRPFLLIGPARQDSDGELQ